MPHSPESNREPRKVEEQGESTPNLPLLPGAPDHGGSSPTHTCCPFPQTLGQGGRRDQTKEGTGCHLYANCLECHADEGSYANVCPLGRQAKTLPSLIWGPGAGWSIPFSLGFPLSPPPAICSLPLQLPRSPLTNICP